MQKLVDADLGYMVWRKEQFEHIGKIWKTLEKVGWRWAGCGIPCLRPWPGNGAPLPVRVSPPDPEPSAASTFLHFSFENFHNFKSSRGRKLIFKNLCIKIFQVASLLPKPHYEGISRAQARLLYQNFICTMLAIRGGLCYSRRCHFFSRRCWVASAEHYWTLSCKSRPAYLDWAKLGKNKELLSDDRGLEGKENLWQCLFAAKNTFQRALSLRLPINSKAQKFHWVPSEISRFYVSQAMNVS